MRLAVLALLPVIALAGTLLTRPAAAEKPRLALVVKSLANEFVVTMTQSALAHQKQHAERYTLVAHGIRNETDVAAQIRIVEQMVADKVDALVISPADSKALVPAIQAAASKGVLVVNIDDRLDAAALRAKGLHVPFVGPDNRAGARMVGAALAKTLKAGDEVGIIEGVSSAYNAQQRTLGFQDAMRAAGIPVVAVHSGQWEIDKSHAVAASMMRAHPDLKALLAGNDSMALGAVAAVKAAGKAGQVAIVGYDNIGAIGPMLKDGRVLATADQFAARQAVFGIETALKALAARTPQWGMTAEVKTDVVLVTRDTR